MNVLSACMFIRDHISLRAVCLVPVFAWRCRKEGLIQFVPERHTGKTSENTEKLERVLAASLLYLGHEDSR